MNQEFKIGDFVLLKNLPEVDKVFGIDDRMLEAEKAGVVYKISRQSHCGRGWYILSQGAEPRFLYSWLVKPEWIVLAEALKEEAPPKKVKKVAKKKKKVQKRVRLKALGPILNKGDFGGRCGFAIRYKALVGGKVHDYIHRQGACHYSFRRNNHVGDVYLGNAEVVDAVEHIAHFIDEHKGKDAWKAFFTWLFNSSPWKDCFKTKSYASALRYGVYYNVDQPHGRLLSAAVFMRCSSEFPEHVKGWYKEVSEGVDPNVAVLTGIYMEPFSRKIRGVHGGHQAVTSSHNAEQLLKFLANDGKVWGANAGNEPWRKKDNYSICASIAEQHVAGDKSIGGLLAKLVKGYVGEPNQWGDYSAMNKEQWAKFREEVTDMVEKQRINKEV